MKPMMRDHARVLRRIIPLLALSILGATLPADAGAPLLLHNSGNPYVWPNGGVNSPFNPDLSGLGPLTNAEAVALTEAAFGAWAAVPTATITFTNAGPLPADIDITNFADILFFPVDVNGFSEVVYDENGEIFDLLFGPFSGILAFAGPDWVETDDGTILEALAFINGPPIEFYGPEGALDIFVHEFGHWQNLAHSVVNGQMGLGDNSGPSPVNTFPLDDHFQDPNVETMYWLSFGTVVGTSTPDKDDAAIQSVLYPEPDFRSSTGTITGRVYGADGVTPLDGVNVIARNVADPYRDAVSSFTGRFTFLLDHPDPFTGYYELAGLTPGATYVVYVDGIFAGAYPVPPAFPLPGFEEFYNGASESSDPATDDPQNSVGVTLAAGEIRAGVDVIFNRFVPGPIPVGDDQGLNLPLPFTFSFCGRDYDELFVHPNGFLTQPLTFTFPDPLEFVSEFLAFEPRIAAMWDDLNPTAGGVVSFDQTSETFSVRWDNVPEFPDVGSNTFEIILHRASSRVEIVYGDMTMEDGLAGYTCGGFVTNGREPESDLSALAAASEETINGRNQEAIYDLFTPDDPIDLANTTLNYVLPDEFRDRLEPNNTVQQAAPIKLPFNSEDPFTAVSTSTTFPPLPDVDFFRFRASAGTTIVAETLPVHFFGDSAIGLFDVATGALLALDDDGGVGFWSRLEFEIPADGFYAVAVTGFPDYDFDGDPLFWFGRYILDVQETEGPVATAEQTSTEASFTSAGEASGLALATGAATAGAEEKAAVCSLYDAFTKPGAGSGQRRLRDR